MPTLLAQLGLLSGVGFPSPCCQVQSSTRRQGERAPPQRSHWQRKERGKDRDQSQPSPMAYSLLAAFFELTSTGEQPPATHCSPVHGLSSQTHQRAGKGTQCPLSPETLGYSQGCRVHLPASPWLSSFISKHNEASLLNHGRSVSKGRVFPKPPREAE